MIFEYLTFLFLGMFLITYVAWRKNNKLLKEIDKQTEELNSKLDKASWGFADGS